MPQSTRPPRRWGRGRRRGGLANSFLLALGGSMLAAVGVLAVLGLLGVFTHTPPEDEVSDQVDRLLQAAAEGRFADTYRTETVLSLRESTPLKRYQDLGQFIQDRFGVLRSKIQVAIRIEPVAGVPEAAVVYQGNFEKGIGVIRAELRNVQGKWLLLTLDVAPAPGSASPGAK